MNVRKNGTGKYGTDKYGTSECGTGKYVIGQCAVIGKHRKIKDNSTTQLKAFDVSLTNIK